MKGLLHDTFFVLGSCRLLGSLLPRTTEAATCIACWTRLGRWLPPDRAFGPFGYLPTDPQKLSDELNQRGLKLSAGMVFEHLHQDDSWDAVWTKIQDVASLTAAVGGKHVVVIPDVV